MRTTMEANANAKVKTLLDELAAVLAEMGAIQDEEMPADARNMHEALPDDEEDEEDRGAVPTEETDEEEVEKASYKKRMAKDEKVEDAEVSDEEEEIGRAHV